MAALLAAGCGTESRLGAVFLLVGPERLDVATNQLAKTNQLGYFRAMEKRTPHCKLSVVQGLVQAGKVRVTVSFKEL